MKPVVAIGLMFGLVAGAWAAEPSTSNDPADLIYSLGFQLGRDLSDLKGSDGGTPDMQSLFRGVADAMSGAQPAVSTEEMNKLLADFRRQTGAAAPASGTSFDARQTQAFNALNAQREGVVTLQSGLQYKVLKAGTGRQPQPSDTLTLSYKATLPNGVVVDSTDDDSGPAKLRLDEVTVAGLRQALGLMREGAEWEVYVPPALGFTNEFSTLRDRPIRYDVELISVTPGDGPNASAVQQ